MTSWLKRCPTWQAILTIGGLTFLGVATLGAAVQWILTRHLDFSTITGSAVGTMLASMVMGWWWRVGQLGSC